MREHPYQKKVSCEQCGRLFVDDCGDAFCSSKCESEYEREHKECEHCGEIVGEDNLTNGVCESCITDFED